MWVQSVAKKIAYLIAILIIIVAVLVSASRLLTPVLDKHRPGFEQWASTLLDTPVTIEHIHLSWHGYQPALSFENVTAFNQTDKSPILQVKNIKLFFSIPSSLWRWSLVPNGIMISGSAVNLHESGTGEIKLQGFPNLGGFNSKPYSTETKMMDVLGWLSQQPRLIVQDISVGFTQKTGEKRLVTLYHLSFENDGLQHVVLGKATLHQSLPTDVTFAVQWQGRVIDYPKIKAKIYIYVSGLVLSQWVKGISWQGWQVKDGVLSAKLWANWGNGEWRKIQSTLQLYGLNLYSETNQSTHQINRFSGNVGWKRQDQNIVVAGDDILIDLPAHLWPVTSFYVSLTSNQQGQWYPTLATLGYVDLTDVQSFLFSSSLPEADSVRKTITKLHLKGSLQNTSISFANPLTDIYHTSFATHFNDLSFASSPFAPGAEHLSGALMWNGSQGDIKLNANRVVLNDDSLFNHPINIDQLSGDIQFQQDDAKAWQIKIPSLQLLNNDLAANATGTITAPPNALPTVDIKANLTMQNAGYVTRYLPVNVFDKDLDEWLNQAFLSGEVKSASLVLRGPLADFPFDKQNGLFSVTAQIKNIDLRYAPDWPVMRHINGKLQFLGRKMIVDVDSAEVHGMNLKNVHGIIPYLGDDQPQVLSIDGDTIQTDFIHAMNFVHSSPLEKTIGKMFEDVDISGPLQLKLGLVVPLKEPGNSEVKGLITLNNAQLNLAPWNLAIGKLNGQLQFTENSVQAKGIQGLLFNKPFTFDLSTVQKTKAKSLVRVIFSNQLNIADLQAWLKLPLDNYAQGSTKVNGEIDLAIDAPIELHLQSDLTGLTIDHLPNPYNKQPNSSRPTTVDIVAKVNEPLRIRLNYTNLLGAALVLERKQAKLNLLGVNLQLGGGVVNWPKTNGLYISGHFDSLSWQQIKDYLNQSTGSGLSNLTAANLKLQEVDITTAVLDLGGQTWHDVSLQIAPSQTAWNVTVNSPDVVGQIQVPTTGGRSATIVAQFQRINLYTTNNQASKTPAIDVKSMPAFSFVANNVNYNDMPLGQVTLKTLPTSKGLTIDTFNIISPRLNLHASGEWTQTNNKNMTRLRGNAVTGQLSELLRYFGLDVSNFVANKGSLVFDLNWRDAPFSPSLANLSGQASLDIGPGRVVDVGEGGGTKMGIGRMLSIFSLQTIPRRLSLDFSDVFQKGYSFDYIRGDVALQNGDAITKNLSFEGPVAGVGINGRIGLKNKNYHFILSVTPHVTSSIPLAAGLITMNPLIGLGAFAVNSVIGSQVSKATTYYYAVTGTWDKPVWKESRAP